MKSGLVWTDGYTLSELEAAQERYGLTFPPDLIELLLDRRLTQSFDWRTDDELIRKKLAWPLEGIMFDIEENGFWLPQWGERPGHKVTRREIATAAVAAAPLLIPLYSHRYLPSEPSEAGNPVLSVYQTDIIYYGTNLVHYIENEFGSYSWEGAPHPRRIRFWSDLIDGAR